MDVYTKNIVEFVTVGVEYCAFLERIAEKDYDTLVSVMQKLLPFLYMKTALLEKPVLLSDSNNAQNYVKEEEYEAVRNSIANILEGNDAFLDGENGASISENMADIYQDIKDFVMNYKAGNADISADALNNCLIGFETYWGKKLLATTAALHDLKYNPKEDEDVQDDDFEG